MRGILQSEYGVDLDRITWVPTDEEHVAEFRAPRNVDYRWRGKPMAELLSGPCDAAIGDVRVQLDAIKPLIPDARVAGFAWFRKTGIYPINHGVVIKAAALEAAPWIADALFDAFKASKAAYLSRLKAGGDHRLPTPPPANWARWSAIRSRSASKPTARRSRRSCGLRSSSA